MTQEIHFGGNTQPLELHRECALCQHLGHDDGLAKWMKDKSCIASVHSYQCEKSRETYIVTDRDICEGEEHIIGIERERIKSAYYAHSTFDKCPNYKKREEDK